jgi:hypothetical protein
MLRAALATLVLLPILAAAKIVAVLLGLVAVAVALPFAYSASPPALPATVQRSIYPGWSYLRLPVWADWLWGNDKYGAMGNWLWRDRDPLSYWAQYVWLALRNPANNLQRYSLFRFDTDPARVRCWGDLRVDDVAGLAGWQLVSCGWRAGFYWIMPWARERCLRVRLGYKIDAAASTPTSAALSVLVNPWANFGR